MKITLFKNSYAEKPIGSITIEDFVERVRSGHWSKQVLALREKEGPAYKRYKESLPAVTISGEFASRDVKIPTAKRLKKHSGLICLDIDRKDNVKMRTKDLIDSECYAQFVSCSGEGLKIIYRCVETKDVAEHRRIYDAAVARLQKKGIKLKVDPIVKSVASLQYVTYDPEIFFRPSTKLVIKPLPAPKKQTVRPPSDNVKQDIEQLTAYVECIGSKDVTDTYEKWLMVAFGLAYSLGEHGRPLFHKISCHYANYSKEECDEQYDACLERKIDEVEKPVTIASVFQILNDGMSKASAKQLHKKYNVKHAVGAGEDVQQSDLVGMVTYKLFLFKKIFDSKSNELIDIVPHSLNLNAFEKLLKELGFYRYNKLYVQIVDNVVELVDSSDILRIVTKYVEEQGDYIFTYSNLEFKFSWEEITHRWREKRGMPTVYNQIAASLEHWKPNLLKDSGDTSYVPYLNGVVKVNAKEIKLIPYASVAMQIWKERILPRNFVYSKTPGMFEEFFKNVVGKPKDKKSKDENFFRACWYYGYMLQGTKRQSTARAWMLYDTKPGNNGRTGKTILGQAVGKIRSMVTIDGKQIDFTNRFAFQTVQPWTDVVFIDDPKKGMSLQPLFNMITGDTVADRKGIDPVVKPLKFMFASNWILEQAGSSEAGRQFVTQMEDYYVQWGKANGNTITPIVDYHGKEFFTDWDAKDWSAFDSFSMHCLQLHLRAEVPSNNIVGNSAVIRFVQNHEQEMFYELASMVMTNTQAGTGGYNYIPQGLLINIVKEYDSRYSTIAAGRLVREFLQAIGCAEIGVSSIVVAGQNRMAYKFAKPIKDLDFGGYGIEKSGKNRSK